MIERTMSARLLRSAQQFRVVALLGPRQSGKTTLVKKTFSNHRYISLEDLDMAAHAKNDPRDFFRVYRNEYGIILDEFQNVPTILSYMQSYVDEHQKPGYFILTGSQNFLMNEAITQTLAGRIAIHTLLPLTMQELADASLLPQELEVALVNGFYPTTYTQILKLTKDISSQPAVEDSRRNLVLDEWYANYIRTYVERDIRQISQVTDLNLFQKFTKLCAARIGQIVNLTSLGNECGISDVTAKKWLSLLASSYILFLLYPHHKNFNKRLVKNPKIYFYDTGLACALLKITPEFLATHPIKGSLFESFAIAEIAKYFYNKGIEPPIYFWRDHTGNEVDCIVEQGLSLIPIEIKSNCTITSKFFEGINYWKKLAQSEQAEGFIIYAGTETQQRSTGTVVSWQQIDRINL